MSNEDFTAILVAEYSRWRAVEDAKIQDFAMGAMGAISNVIAGVAKDMTPEQYREWIKER